MTARGHRNGLPFTLHQPVILRDSAGLIVKDWSRRQRFHWSQNQSRDLEVTGPLLPSPPGAGICSPASSEPFLKLQRLGASPSDQPLGRIQEQQCVQA